VKPKVGYDYLTTVVHFVVEFFMGTDMNVCIRDGFTKLVDALVCYIDSEKEDT